MNKEQFDKVSADLTAECVAIQEAKRPAYTIGNEDVLHNFKSVAERVGITPGQVLSVYFLKHVDAVISALAKPHLPQAEAVKGRFADLVNYAHLGYALLEDGKLAGTAPAPPQSSLSGQSSSPAPDHPRPRPSLVSRLPYLSRREDPPTCTSTADGSPPSPQTPQS